MSNNHTNTFSADSESFPKDEMWERILGFVGLLWQYFKLFFALTGFILVINLSSYFYVKPTYTVSVVVGPPPPSPTSNMLSSMNGGLNVNSAARSILGGGSSTGDNMFSEYLQVLYSHRIAEELMQKDNLLRILFHGRWDESKKNWKDPGYFFQLRNWIMSLMHRSVNPYPNSNDIEGYLQKHLTTGRVDNIASAFASSNYLSISLDDQDYDNGIVVMNAVINRADDIIRQEHLRDTKTRIQFIKKQLADVSQSEQKDMLINTLQNQNNLEVMLYSDKHYSYSLIDPPRISQFPTKPSEPKKAILMSIAMSSLLWVIMVFASCYSARLAGVLAIFRSKHFGASQQRC